MTYPNQPNNPSAEDEFMDAAGIKAASFNGPPPITWAGNIVNDAKLVDKRNMDTGEVEVWGNGEPKKQLLVVIQTDVRDPADADDDGRRGFWLEYKKKDAVVQAMKHAGAKGAPKKGGWLSLTYTDDDYSVKVARGKQQPKNWQAEYRAPDPWTQVPGSEGAGAPQGAPQQQGWGGMPPQGQQPPQGPPQGQQGGAPTGAYGYPNAAAAAQAAQAAQPQYQQQQMPAPGPAAAAPGQSAAAPAAQQADPLGEFLSQRNIDINVMAREQALMIAQNLGYQGS